MISPETRVQIRRYFYAEHWKIGTIAQALHVHPDTVRRAIEVERFQHAEPLRPSIVDPYLPFVREVLDQHPRLRATRIYQMVRDRGYAGSVEQLRRAVARLRPQPHEAFLRLQVFPAEQAQVDWAYFGSVMVGRAKRQLSCFVITLSWSRALYLEFFFDQTMENFLRGHVRAFQDWSGAPRVILYDNLRSAVLERRGDQIHFNPRLLELAAHYHFAPRPCQVRAGNQKGRVERAIRFVRDSFWAGRVFTTLAECNRQALVWRDEVAHQRRWPDDSARSVAQAFAEEQPRLLALPLHPFNTDRIEQVHSRKTIYVHFDLNDYSIPPRAVGRPLTLVASDTDVRILDGAAEIGRHHRSYDRQQSILDPAHEQALLRTKRKALHGTRAGRLALAVPESEALLERAFAAGESAVSQTSQLLRLLDLYGVAALRRAIREALERNTPRASSVAFLLRRDQRSSPLPALDLSRHPEAQALDVRPHDLETYDELAHSRDDDSHE
ncbi:MAG TPA: IS21 family transposase [Bryobacteraceae bacterium]